jgi:hypothetical protein
MFVVLLQWGKRGWDIVAEGGCAMGDGLIAKDLDVACFVGRFLNRPGKK